MNNNVSIIYVGSFRLPNLDAAAPRVINNAKALREVGCEVRFISWGGAYREEDLCDDGKYRVCGFEYMISGDLPVMGSKKERFLTRLHRGQRSIDILESLPHPDLIITYNASNSFTKRMIRYCEENDIKLANDVNEWYSNGELHLPDILPNYINMTLTQRRVKNKIVISSYLYKYYHDSNNILVPPLCDLEDSKWDSVVDDDRVKPFNGITLIYAGTPGKKDCLNSVVEAVISLANEEAAVRLIVLGTTKEAYLKSGKHRYISDSVLFLGRVSQDLVPASYKKADFMVLLRAPSRKSMVGFPTKVAESVTAGIPVITNATSDLTKYVVNGRTGFISDGYGVESILSTLQKFVLPLGKGDIEDLKSNVRSIRDLFDWRFYVEDFRSFIKRLK